MRHRTTLTLLALVPVLAVLAVASGASAANGGNSANAKLCQGDGWETLTRSDGSSFVDAGACVSYAARGGTFGTGPAWTLVVSACTPEPGFTCVEVTGSGLEPGSVVTLFRDTVSTGVTVNVDGGGNVSIPNAMTECSAATHTFQAAGTAAGGAPAVSNSLVAQCGS